MGEKKNGCSRHVVMGFMGWLRSNASEAAESDVPQVTAASTEILRSGRQKYTTGVREESNEEVYKTDSVMSMQVYMDAV